MFPMLESVGNLLQNPYDTNYLPHLRHVVTLPLKMKNSIFLQILSRYGNNANKLHFKSTDFNLSMCVTVCAD